MISVRNVSKVFRIPHAKKKTLYHSLLSMVTGRFEFEELYALNDITLDVKPGEFVGIIGRNGSGKSTLLKVLSRVYMPTAGRVSVRGEVYPLLELGIGFQADFTVRENLYIYGSFIGFSRKEMNSRIGEILKFSELERFVDAKLDNISSGMKVRLAFAIAMQADASIYLVDEVLAVGDKGFQEKCKEEFRRLKAAGKTVLFVSHGEDVVEEFCDRVIVLADGRIVNQGKAQEMIDFYNAQYRSPSNVVM